MLVRNGHGIILKTIMGRIPASVTHIAFGTSYGSGIKSGYDFTRENMGFEVLRVPVQVAFDHLTSTTTLAKGNEEFQLVYKGEVPTNRRIAFNEIGLWCGSANLRYGDAGGVLVSTAESAEHWLRKTYETGYGNTLVQTDLKVLTEDDFFKTIQAPYYASPTIKLAQPRIGNTALPIEAYVDSSAAPHIVYELPVNIDVSQYSPEDTIKLAVTWTPTLEDVDSFDSPFSIRWGIDLIFSFISSQATFAQKVVPLEYDMQWGPNYEDVYTYKVLETELGDLTDANRGTLNSIGIRVTGETNQAGISPGDPSFVLLDGIRIDRSVNNNPLYGLVFYDFVSKTVTVEGKTVVTPIEKLSGFDGHLEHRVRMFANATGQEIV